MTDEDEARQTILQCARDKCSSAEIMTDAERRERATLKRRGSGILETEKQAERRERARLRSERWRRAHGIGPHKPARKPWLAEGVSRSTWYRRGNRISGRFPNLTPGKSSNLLNLKSQTVLELTRAESFVRELQAELAEVDRCQAVMAAIIGELSVIR
jgi:hypothetical protein